jgi:osmoprotectant transport system ATP-binding protein
MFITLEKVTKSIGNESLLEETSLTFAEHQTTAIIGPSGCGKSTLLRLILRLAVQTSGTIYLDKQVLNSSNADYWRQQIGYVTQDGGLFPHLSVRHNIILMGNFLNYKPEWIEERLQKLSELIHLPPRLLSQYPSELSGGQRQRVSLLRALFLDPQCLLLDEPLGALDPISRYELQVELKQIFNRLGKTILLVTHDMREAAYFGDEILLMREGRVVQKGSHSELDHHPIEPFVTEFIRLQQFPEGAH